jgi:VanZ family protein
MRPVFFYQPSNPTTAPESGWGWWLRVWAPVVIAIGVICAESTGTFSAQNTSGWLRPIFERLFGVMTEDAWGNLHHLIRKSGHFVGYGTVGFTFLRAWLHMLDRRGVRKLATWRIQSALLAILSTALVASADEIHQTFLPSRCGSPLDVLLDSTGALTLCLLVWLLFWCRRTESCTATGA